MAKPDVRVRISAEGTGQVVTALKKVESQAKRTAATTKRSFGGTNQVLAIAKGQLLGLAAAVSVGAFTALIRKAADYTGQLGELSVGLGTTTEALSGLAVQAKINGVSFEAVQKGLARTTKNVSDFKSGAGIAVRSFKALGLAVEDFEGKDTSEQFETIARGLAKMEDGSDKTAIAYSLFSRNAVALLPILNEIGTVGMEGVIQKARELGVLFDDDVVAATDALADRMSLLGFQTQGLAAQFVAGLAPSIQGALDGISAALGDSAESWKTFGEVVGVVLKWIIGLVTFLVDNAGTQIWLLWQTAVTIVNSGRALLRGDIAGAGQIMKEGQEKMLQGLKDRGERAKKLWENLTKPPEAPKAKDPLAKQQADASQLYQDRVRALDAALQAELRLVRLNLRLRTQAERRAYLEAEQTVKKHYDERRRIASEGVAAEIDVLERQIALQADNTERGQADIQVAKLRGQITEKQIALQGILLGLSFEELNEVRKLNQERVAISDKLLEQQGRGHEVTLRQIQEQSDKYAKILAKQGNLSDEAQAAEVARVQTGLEAGAEFDRRIQDFQLALAELNTRKREIQSDVDAGLVSQIEGEAQILALERDRAVTLEKLIGLAQAAALVSGSPEQVQAAQDLAVAVRNLGVAADDAQNKLSTLRQEIGDVLTPVMTEFFETGITGAESFGGAMQEMAGSVVKSIRRMIAQYLALKAIQLFLPGFAGGGQAQRKAAGGQVSGPGTGISDSVPAWLSVDEFVVKAAVVRQPGMLEHLKRINAGLATANVGLGPGVRRRFADGGQVGVKPAEARLGGQLTVALEEGLVLQELETAEGQRALIRVMSRNRRALRQALGGS